MDISLLVWLSLALLLFWCVGLYNRLMRLRARGIEVLAVVEKHAGTCATLVKQHALPSGEARAAVVAGPWLEVNAAAVRLEQLLAQSRPISLQPSVVTALSDAWAAMQAAWLEVSSGPGDLAGSAIPPDLQEAWSTASLKVQSASGGFNQIIARYNEAIQQYPARWVASLMGFHVAGHF
jgi:LemA protein